MLYDRPPKTYVGTGGIVFYSVVLALLGYLIAQNVFGVWPRVVPDQVLRISAESPSGPFLSEDEARAALEEAVKAEFSRRRAADTLRISAFGVGRKVGAGDDWDFRLLLIAALVGALGSWVHCVSSFVRYAGNRQLVSSWGPWYALRPFLGAGMAMIFYMVLRAGLVNSSGQALENFSHYSVAAFAALAGLFTQRASKKLAQVFDALFTPRPQDEDEDYLSSGLSTGTAKPAITALSPQWVRVGVDPVAVEITGTGFTGNATVKVDGTEVSATRVAEGKLSFTLEARHRSAKGAVAVAVETSAGSSESKRLIVTP